MDEIKSIEAQIWLCTQGLSRLRDMQRLNKRASGSVFVTMPGGDGIHFPMPAEQVHEALAAEIKRGERMLDNLRYRLEKLCARP